MIISPNKQESTQATKDKKSGNPSNNEKIKALMFVNKRYEQVDIKRTFTIKGMMIYSLHSLLKASFKPVKIQVIASEMVIS